MMKIRKIVGVAVMAMAAVVAGSAYAEECKEKNIVETAKAAGSFKTLLAAAEAAGLAETLATGGPFTVLAPTDEAFAKLPKGTVEGLLEKPEELKKILLHHVIEGEVLAETVVTLTEAKSLLGQTLTIDTEDGVKVGGATVVKTDVKASNGVIHVIDTVILPAAE